MTKEESNTIYQLGARDMIANLFMEIRTEGVEETLKKYAKLLEDNPHAKYYIQSLKTEL